MKKLLALLVATACAGAAHADHVSYSDSYGPASTDWEAPGQALTLQKFNASLGTLNSVKLSWNGQMSSVFSATAGEFDPSNVDFTAFGSMAFLLPVLGTKSLNLGPQTGSMALDPGQTNQATVDLLGSDSQTLGADAVFIGTGTFGVSVQSTASSLMSEDSGNGSTDIATAAFAKVEVVYDYTPNRNTVPEPASLALLGVALAAAAAASRRRA